MKQRSHQTPIKPKVHLVFRHLDVVKVFRGSRKKAALKWCEEQKKFFPNDIFSVTTCEVD